MKPSLIQHMLHVIHILCSAPPVKSIRLRFHSDQPDQFLICNFQPSMDSQLRRQTDSWTGNARDQYANL